MKAFEEGEEGEDINERGPAQIAAAFLLGVIIFMALAGVMAWHAARRACRCGMPANSESSEDAGFSESLETVPPVSGSGSGC